MKIEITEVKQVEVKFLKVDAGVRYWEDTEVNGVEDTEDGSLIPFNINGRWKICIELEAGRIINWPEGTISNVHYKVCDNGNYSLLDELGSIVKEINGYVPDLMSPGGNGYGDYIIMDINADGFIQGWNPKLTEFQGDDNY